MSVIEGLRESLLKHRREFVHVLVLSPESIFGRHAESFVLVGPILEGMVGALTSFNGVVHA